MKTEDKTP